MGATRHWAGDDRWWGSNLGWLTGSRIERPNGATWASLDDAKAFADCPDAVAAALWVLSATGRL